MPDRDQIEKAIEALEAQRPTLGDTVVELAIAPLRQQLAALRSQGGVEQQRKFVAVLFANVVLQIPQTNERQEESEEMVDLVKRMWERLDPIIEAHGGAIDKHMGSAVMALWGGEIANENDPEQAVRAALAMQSELKEMGASSEDDFSRLGDLQLQAGVHYGLAVLGEVGTTGERTAIGDTVNTASRIQNAAATGEILISNDVYRHVAGMFDVQALAPMAVKGKADPLRLYKVLYVRQQTFRSSGRGIEGVETRMIGRQNELEQLQQVLKTASQTYSTQGVLVLGEAGVGKSRLLYEFHHWVEHEMPRVVRMKGRAAPHSNHLPYALLRNIFAIFFEIRDDDPASAVMAKLESGISGLLGPARSSLTPGELRRRAHFLGALLGYAVPDSPYLDAVRGDPRQLYDRALNDLARLFVAATRQQPVLILLEDIHWADSQSLDTLQTIVRKQPNLPLMLVGTARPSLYERYPNWDNSAPIQYRVVLRRLTADQSLHLLQEILQKVDEIPPELYGLVIPRAEGNPYYIEEFIKMLIDDGIIHTNERVWKVDGSRLANLHVPSTLTGVLQARLDSLEGQEKTVIQRASVVGRTFWETALDYLNKEAAMSSPLGINLALQRLQERELIYQRNKSVFADTSEYIFKHALLRDVAYESVLKRDRRMYHARAARWLVEVTIQNERSDEYAALISEHFELAGEPEQAARWYEQAYQHAITRYANTEAAGFLRKAAALLPPNQFASRYRLLYALESILDLEGDRTAQAEVLAALQKLLAEWVAAGSPSKPSEATSHFSELLLRRAEYAEATGDYNNARYLARQAIEQARQAGQLANQAKGCLVLGQSYINQTEFSAAQSVYLQGLDLARQAGSGDLEANCLRSLGRVASEQSEYSQANEYYQQAVAMFRLTNDRRGESDALTGLGSSAVDSSNYPAALGYFEQALMIKRELGDRRGEGRVLGNLGFIASDQGNYARSKAYFEQAKQIFFEVGDRRAESIALINLGSDALAQGDYQSAQTYQLQAIEIQKIIGHRQGMCISLDNLSLVTYHLGDFEKALAYCRQTAQLAEELGLRRMVGFSYHHRGHALLALGSLTEAEQSYQKAYELRMAIGEKTNGMESLAGVAAAALANGEPARALSLVEVLLEFLKSEDFVGMVEPFWVYWTCYEALQANQDRRAVDVLAEASQAMLERADKIGNEKLRLSYLTNVRVNRAIQKAFNQQPGRAQPGPAAG